jgi:hypothetical protein
MKNFVQKLAGSDSKAIALRFVLMFGVISLFADFTYEGSRSIVGPYLGQLGASGTAVGIIAGLGELLGYGLRLVSGRVAEKTGAFWPITLFGYAIQMISVPLLALAGSWQVAALLIVAERIGRATRNPSGYGACKRGHYFGGALLERCMISPRPRAFCFPPRDAFISTPTSTSAERRLEPDPHQILWPNDLAE